MPKKTNLTDEEAALFRASVKGTAPLVHDKVSTAKHPPKSIRKRKPLNLEPVTLSAAPNNLIKVRHEDKLKFSRSGIQPQVMRKLMRGSIPALAELDLHGCTIVQAEQKLAMFLAYAKRKQLRCIRIIHGKGHRTQQPYPILKNQVNYWLQSEPDVLAFCSAKAADGGTGAVYVLLKQREMK